MKVIIAGGRNYNNYETLLEAIQESSFLITEVVCGGATGVDTLGEKWANEHGIPIKYFEANWDKWGKAAGPKRNKQMSLYGEALIAIWDGVSRGTQNMIHYATSNGLKVYIKRV